MKNFKLILVVCLLFSGANAMAFGPHKGAEKLTANYTLSIYVDAVQNGKIDGFAQVIDENAKFTSERGNKLVSHSKEEVLKAMQPVENAKQNCEVTHSILETFPHQIIAKINMKYDTFSKVNYVTMSESENGWKIVHVSTVFE